VQAAIDSLTRSLALEWGTDYGIRCNGIAPGSIAGTPGMYKLNPDEAQVAAENRVPLGKFGEKWDIAMAAIFLACETGNFYFENNDSCMLFSFGKVISYSRFPIIYTSNS